MEEKHILMQCLDLAWAEEYLIPFSMWSVIHAINLDLWQEVVFFPIIEAKTDKRKKRKRNLAENKWKKERRKWRKEISKCKKKRSERRSIKRCVEEGAETLQVVKNIPFYSPHDHPVSWRYIELTGGYAWYDVFLYYSAYSSLFWLSYL